VGVYDGGGSAHTAMFPSQIIQLSCQMAAAALINASGPIPQIVAPACQAMYSPQVVESTYNFYPYMYRW
jgi:hypothetical protein